jgi:hypothetical protein
MSKPIKVYQCKDDCCAVQVPAKRFWIATMAGFATAHAHFSEAIETAAEDAALLRATLPTLEPSA